MLIPKWFKLFLFRHLIEEFFQEQESPELPLDERRISSTTDSSFDKKLRDISLQGWMFNNAKSQISICDFGGTDGTNGKK